jgi:uncharacterized protein
MRMSTPTIIVLAKAPEPGRVKTRLCPPLTSEEAAAVARSALQDTLAAAVTAAPGEVVLALDGRAGAWLTPFDVRVVAQRGDGLDSRIAAAFADVGGPALLIGMDTPQVSAELLAMGRQLLAGNDAVLGRADDGGFWAIGALAPACELFVGVPMSQPHTGAVQQRRLEAHCSRVARLPALRDVDLVDDALAVAADAPATRFAVTLAEVLATRVVAPGV